MMPAVFHHTYVLSLCVADKGRCVRWSMWIRADLWDHSTTPTAIPAVCSHKLGSWRQCCQVRPCTTADWCHILHGEWTGWGPVPDAEGTSIYCETEEQWSRWEGTCWLHHEPCRCQQRCLHIQVRPTESLVSGLVRILIRCNYPSKFPAV